MERPRREATLTELVDAHQGELRRFALRLTQDQQAAEDVVQEVLLRAWRDPHLLDHGGPGMRAWLFTVARRLVVDRWRSAAARHESIGDPSVEPGEADRSSEVLDRWIVLDALRSLSLEHRQVIAAAYYEGRGITDIASELQIPEGTVKSRLHYGLRALRLVLQEKGVTRP
ncbi:MAG: sigma-70 family RNA polymerase sigma factor [Intrasporangium sp.]|uniref:sigma-70 family RNA polymerase sigma factor n=1 Tax=Intrasporangium sp. TaxID=1925024 RepID=UPI003F7E72E7